ncbi:helix-turn-helix domain-containing protein [Aquabacterium sp.]|uniref:helix-turn-helix domain-containing protein n=1 Tax=Aquabacterium sp. TaxID=1872578 RepID=UPI0024879074|nr:helix-turn-helix domain-containing protein [Aquabacterium sp.]MDI1260244.1 helix-turn-helix domain-containing protein [Aquabacterium sp.]
MSVRAMATIWESSLAPPSLKLTALALADWSNDDGGSLHPSMSAIAKKVGVSRCQAQRLVQLLKSDGLLSVVANAHGGAPGDTPHYRLHLDRFSTWTGSTHATGSAGDTGSTDARRRVAPMHKRGSTHATLTTIEPSIEPPDTSSPPKKPTRLACPGEQIRGLYLELLPELPAIKAWTTRRQTATRSRWDEMAKARGWVTVEQGLAWFRKFFETVAASDFLMGRVDRKPGHEGWRCDFDDLMNQTKFVRVIEGKYANREVPA